MTDVLNKGPIAKVFPKEFRDDAEVSRAWYELLARQLGGEPLKIDEDTLRQVQAHWKLTRADVEADLAAIGRYARLTAKEKEAEEHRDREAPALKARLERIDKVEVPAAQKVLADLEAEYHLVQANERALYNEVGAVGDELRELYGKHQRLFQGWPNTRRVGRL